MSTTPFKSVIEAFARDYLDNYVTELKSRPKVAHAKEFNDPVWGTIVARPHEVVVIDSPLFQRLQEVNQLGVAHLVYRSANHTRFEHSLGALHAASILIREVNETVVDELRHDVEDDDLSPPVTPELETALRLAALVHDIGHGYMSHVSENAFRNSPWAINLVQGLDEELPAAPDGVQLSELASYFIVTSPSFTDLLFFLSSKYKIGDAKKIQSLMANSILGMTVDEGRPFLGELISGPFDVDKLDYIQRDALMCGVPTVIDTNRLIRKLRTTRSSRQQIPPAVAERIESTRDSFVVTGIHRSGARTLDEFALARSLLTDKIYRHQKVRAYEALVGSASEILADLSQTSMQIMWSVTDLEFLALPIGELAKRCGIVSRSKATLRKLALVDSLRRMYRFRDEYAAAYTWTSAETGPEILDDDIQIQGINDLRAAVRRSVQRQAIEAEIARTATSMITALGESLPIVEAPGDLRYLVRIDPVDEQSRQRGRALLSRAFLIGRQGNIVLFSEDYADVENLSELYLVNREASAIFCPRALAPIVHLAAEEVIFSQYRVRVTESMQQNSHYDRGEVAALRKGLNEAGHYTSALRPLAPEPPVLSKLASKNLVDEIVKKFSRYEGPGPANRAGAGDITPVLVREFARQLSDATLMVPLLKILECIKFVGREDFTRAISFRLDGKRDIDAASTVFSVLGDPDESSGAVSYLVKEVLSSRRIDVQRIDASAESSKDTLVLVDDFVGQGGRTYEVMAGWLGKVPGKHPLSEAGQQWLKAARVVLVYAAGMASAESVVPDRLASLGIKAEVYIHDKVIPTIFDVAKDISGADKVISFLRDVGMFVLRNSYDQSRMRSEENALGYGNHGLLIAFPYSTPKQAVTALWASGETSYGQWQALFPRGDRSELN